MVEKEQADEAYDEDTSGDGYLNGDDEDEETPIPDKPVTYSVEFEGTNIILIVDFKTKAVSGSVSFDDPYQYLDATIEGTINIKTFEVATNFSGIMGWKETGDTDIFIGTINGVADEDLSISEGVILDNEGTGGDFTASRK